jgi:hypothetical protein
MLCASDSRADASVVVPACRMDCRHAPYPYVAARVQVGGLTLSVGSTCGL